MKNRIVWLTISIVALITAVCIWLILVYGDYGQQEFVEHPDGYTQEQLVELKNKIKSNLPKMDGSTSTVPLEAGIRAKLFGISQEDAEAQVIHSTTYGSLYNLIEKSVDVIFSTPLSQEQYKMASEKNMSLELVPVAKEAFVFVVNATNPIDVLTQQQIKDIYSGKITNWKELGGNDAPIVAYQRNATSGSQNYMIDFMAETELMKPVTEFIPASMVGLMDAIAVYDNAQNAIGYSVYAYAADMYGNGNEIKFIKVDGVAPTKDTMTSGEYPLLNYNYAIFDKAKEEDSTTRLLIEWMLTNEGQKAINSAGYIPVKPIKAIEQEIEVYTKKGTGKEKPQNYARADKYYVYDFSDTNYVYTIGEDVSSVYLTQLKNEKLQTAINKFIEESVKEIEQQANATFANGYVISVPGNEYNLYEIKPEIIVSKECVNGYLSVFVNMKYEYIVQNGHDYVYFGKSAVYDLYEGTKLQLSDLFYNGTDFVKYINDRIKKEEILRGELSPEVEMKREFAGIQKDFDNFTLRSVYFTKDNPYFIQGEMFNFDNYYYDIFVVNEPRDMKEIFKDDSKISQEYFMTWAHIYDKVVNEEDEIEYNIAIVDTNNPSVDDKINSYIKDYVVNNFDKAYIDNNYKLSEEDLYYEKNGFDSTYRLFGTERVEYDVYAGQNLWWGNTNLVTNAKFVFDLKTGELISIKRDIKVGE